MSKKKDSLDSLFASSDSDSDEEKENTKKCKPSIQLPEKSKKDDNIPKKGNDSIKTENKEHIQQKTNTNKNNKKRKLNKGESKLVGLKNNQQQNNNKLFEYTSKYAFLYEEDAEKEENKTKKGKYMFLYRYPGKKEDYPNGHHYKKVHDTKRKKKDRDPNAPKQPLTAFFCYMKEEREKAKKKFTEIKKNKELMMKLGEIWKEMNPEKKQKYVDMAKKEKERYEKKKKEYDEHNKLQK